MNLCPTECVMLRYEFESFIKASGKLYFNILYELQCTLISVLDSLEKQFRLMKNIAALP